MNNEKLSTKKRKKEQLQQRFNLLYLYLYKWCWRLKVRVNWTLEHKELELLHRFKEELNKNGHKYSLSRTIELLIAQNCTDPVKRLKEEAKELQRQLMVVTDRIKELEDLK